MLSPPDHDSLRALLPEARLGRIEQIEPIRLGLSGAGVYAVTTSSGPCVLRVQDQGVDAASFAHQLRVLRRAADAGVAPAVLHVDEPARAVVCARVPGMPLAAALGDAAARAAALTSLVDRLRTLHALDASDIEESTPLAHARARWDSQRQRPGFPVWARSLAPQLDAIEATLATDTRRCLSHNDVNPMNVLWDGARAWLVDWEVCGLGHPYYDFAVLALFLRLTDDAAFELIELHDGAPLDEHSRASFRALRQLAALLCGLTFLSLVPDLSVVTAQALADTQSLGDCYAAMRAGQLDPQSHAGQATMGLALLSVGVDVRRV